MHRISPELKASILSAYRSDVIYSTRKELDDLTRDFLDKLIIPYFEDIYGKEEYQEMVKGRRILSEIHTFLIRTLDIYYPGSLNSGGFYVEIPQEYFVPGVGYQGSKYWRTGEFKDYFPKDFLEKNKWEIMEFSARYSELKRILSSDPLSDFDLDSITTLEELKEKNPILYFYSLKFDPSDQTLIDRNNIPEEENLQFLINGTE